MDDTQIFDFPQVPPTREAQRLLFERRGRPDAFDVAYDAAWRLLVDDGANILPGQVEPFLWLLEVDKRFMAERGAARLLVDRRDLKEAIADALEEILPKGTARMDKAALDELRGDIES